MTPVFATVFAAYLARYCTAGMQLSSQSGCQYRITMLEEELERMAPDLGVIEEWKRKDASYVQRLADLETATAARNDVSPFPWYPVWLSMSEERRQWAFWALQALEELHCESFPAAGPPPIQSFWPSGGPLPAAL